MVFQLGAEVYGTPLLSVREVIENRQPKPVPNTPAGFEGVINLRGDVIGVVDLRKLLGTTPQQSLSILVFESEMGTLGGIVDKCLSVLDIPESNIERKGIQSREGSEYCLGIAKINEGLVTLIDLVQVAKRVHPVQITPG
jgi:purine-binding chemotaxis protein CheW